MLIFNLCNHQYAPGNNLIYLIKSDGSLNKVNKVGLAREGAVTKVE